MRARLYGSAKGLSWFPARRIVPIADLLEEGSMGAVVSEATKGKEGESPPFFLLIRSQLDSAYTLLAGA